MLISVHVTHQCKVLVKWTIVEADEGNIGLTFSQIFDDLKAGHIDGVGPWPWLNICELVEPFDSAVAQLGSILSGYAAYLDERNKAMIKRHFSSTPVRSLSSSESIHFLNKPMYVDESLSKLGSAVEQSEDFVPVVVSEFCPPDRRKRYLFTQQLKKGLSSNANIVLYQYSAGGNAGNANFVWKVPNHCSAEDLANRNMQVVRDIEKDIPMYQTRFARREFCETFGKFSGTPSHILREMFKQLTGDKSASEYLSEAQIDERVKTAILSEDNEI
ncbi:Hypothetical predicted protein [Paramuricea clavata]|uniref:Uncharacterized protein n=1 Tax=Paramuricea clavata TaxID=317549 RepID=A0A6S7JZY2_PARCT|nr:Hypothetical predicted protein [Paramuricea clavata]